MLWEKQVRQKIFRITSTRGSAQHGKLVFLAQKQNVYFKIVSAVKKIFIERIKSW
jgi:hypothetical protein